MADCRRRSLLAALGSAGVGSLAGCTTVGQSKVELLVAGSLQSAVSDSLRASTGPGLAVEAHGSVHAARLVADGRRDPDILAVADPALFVRLLSAQWYSVFASNELVVAYNPDTAGGKRVPAGETWTSALRRDDVSLGRTDPDLDPLGYRTLFAIELAGTRQEAPLADEILTPEQRYPETQLLAQFETGSIDAAIVYRNMAAEREYPYRSLPAAVNLSDPSLADDYADVQYELTDGTIARGAPIEYAATRRADDDAATQVFETVLEGAWLSEHGFRLREQYPRMEGNVPDDLSS